MNQIGIYVDDLGNDEDAEVLDALKGIFQKSAEEGTGVLYIIQMW